MSQDLSIEHPDYVFFSTTRTMNSRLWFINNPKLQERICAYLAKYQEVYEVLIYAFIIMGNHYHLLARFPKCNKRYFFKDFNSMIALLTDSYVEEFEGGKLWGRRVRSQVVGDAADVMDRFFYTILNPVGAGICEKISDYTGYNCFHDAAHGINRKYEIIDFQDYNNRKRYNQHLRIEDCVREYTLTFSRLPGCENMKQEEYHDLLKRELDSRRQELVETRIEEGQGFATKDAIRKIKRGAKPRTTKTATRNSKRPHILTKSAELKKLFLDWYFALLKSYKEASRRFRTGDLDAVFPSGTYRPTSFVT